MAGIISIPTAAVVAGPDPEMAPKKRQDKIVEAAMPPVNGPAMASATATRRLEMPADSMSAPERINAGSAMMGNEFTDV